MGSLKVFLFGLKERWHFWYAVHKKFFLLLSVALLLLVAVGSTTVAAYLQKRAHQRETNETVTTKVTEPDNDETAKIAAQKYWQAVVDKDYVTEYLLSENKLTTLISRDEYVKRQQWLDANTAYGGTIVQSFSITSSVYGVATDEVTLKLVTNDGEDTEISTMIYEDGLWKRIFGGYAVLAADKSFEEFVALNSQ